MIFVDNNWEALHPAWLKSSNTTTHWRLLREIGLVCANANIFACFYGQGNAII